MNETLLCQTLMAMTNDEYRQFGEALHSPLFSHSRLSAKCIELHRFFQENGLNFSVSNEEAFAAIYPAKPFSKHSLDNVMSALMDSAREFIAWRQWRNQVGEVGVRLEMARFYRERSLEHRFSQTIEQVHRLLEKQPPDLSADIHFQKYLVELEVYHRAASINDLQNDLNLPATSDNFIQYYLAQGLELALRLEHQAKLTALEFNRFKAFSINLRSLAAQSPYIQNPLIELLEMAFQLVNYEASSEVFGRYVSLLDAEGHRLKFTTHFLLATMARHYCLGMINRGKPQYRPILLGLYKTHLLRGLLYEQGNILHNSLLNIVNMAVGENEGEWAKNFLEAHRFRITGSQSPEVAYHFIKAFLCFNMKDQQGASNALDEAFEEILRLESRSHFKDFNLKLMARKLEIQILYEKDCKSSLLTDRLNAHKMFLHRNKYLNDSHKILHNNFVDLMKQLTQPATQTNAKKAKKLLEKLKQPGFLIADRRWVTEKVEALINAD